MSFSGLLCGRIEATTLLLVSLLTASAGASANPGRVINPFIGANGYVNADYVANVQSSIASAPGALADRMRVVARQPTAVWLDSIDAIDGYNGKRRSLEQHLQAAAGQLTDEQTITLSVVLYSLPNRDCAAKASNGTLLGEAGSLRYREDYIDRIAELFGDDRFADLRIVALIEPDSLPNLVTNRSVAECREAHEQGLYADNIAYALQRFSEISNVYSYLDIGHSGWLGWDNNRARAVQLYTDVVQSSGSLDYLSGVVTNVSGYVPVEELLLPDPNYVIEGQSVKSARFYEYNSQFDERDFALALHEDFVAAGFAEHFGILIDTSRNGWGGEGRPETASWRSSVNAYVDAARLDRRGARGHWCNQLGAGIGPRPKANPFDDGIVHAFVWVKPPGESDGSSDSTQTTPGSDGKQFDPNCDPTATTETGLPTGALPDAPTAGDWFPAQFEMLVNNASPPLDE